MEYDNRGRVSMWKNDRQGDTQPYVTGKICVHRDIKEGETIDLALWINRDHQGNQPHFRGKVSDPKDFNRDNLSGSQSDDDLPF